MEAATAPPAVTPLRDRLRNVKPFSSEVVVVPEWNDERIEVRSMTLGRKLQMASNAVGADGEPDESRLLQEIVIACCFDPDSGDPLFTEDDLDWLSGQNAAAIERLSTTATRISGFTADAVDEGKGDS